MEDKGIDILRKAKYWKFDGTYEKKPKEYNQVYTIVAVFCEYPNWHKSYTTGIVFVKSKDTASYETLFKKLKELIGDDTDMSEKELGFDHEMAAINAAKAVFPESKIILCFWHYPKNLLDYARSKKCSSHLADDINFQKWLRRLIGSSFLPLTWMEEVVDYLLANPPELNPLLKPAMDSFIDYYRKQWREKLQYINYYGTSGPRTTNANESYHSSLNFVIPENRLDFRLCFMRYKESLADAADDYLRSQNGELMKPRKPKYVESERRIMQRKAEMKLLYEGYQENGNRPDMDILLTYCSRQAWNSTEAMDDSQQDPRFCLQPVAASPPILPPNPRPNPQPFQQQQIVHPFFGVQEFNYPQMRQMLNQPIRPQYFQQAPMFPPINLNQSLPVNYNHQFFIQQPQYQPCYQQFHPVYRF